MEGLPVMAVLPGKVASLIADREPYGNMVMIETPLEDLPDWLRDVIPLPAEADVQPAGLLCDPFPPRDSMDSLSLYTVYAHLRDTPQLRPDQTVGCGEQIGAVGTTGRSVNAHLHLEMRSGPSGTRFASMAHYDNSTSEQERLNYCIWRVSGRFQSFDPLLVIKGFEAQRLP